MQRNLQVMSASKSKSKVVRDPDVDLVGTVGAAGMHDYVCEGGNIVAGIVDEEGPVEKIGNAASMLCTAWKSLQTIITLVSVVIRCFNKW